MTSYYYQDTNINQPGSPRITRESIFSPTPEPSHLAQTLSNEVNLDLGTFDLPIMSNHAQKYEEEANDILPQDIQLDHFDKVIEASNQIEEHIEDAELFSDISEGIDAELDDEFLEKIYQDIDKDDQEWLTQTSPQAALASKDIDPLDWLNSRHEDSPVNLPNLKQNQKQLPNRGNGPVSSLPLLHHDPTLGDIGDFDGFASDDNDLFFDGGIVDTSKTNDYMLFGVTEEDLKDTNLDAFSPKGWDIDDEFTIDELLAPIPDLPPLQSEMMAPPDPEVAAYLNQFRKQMRSNENSREISSVLSPNSSEMNSGKNMSYQQESSIRSNSHSRSVSIDLSSPQQSINTPPRTTSAIPRPPPTFSMSKVDSSRKITKPKITPPPNFQSRIPVPIPGYSLYSRRCVSPLEPEFESKIPSIANGMFKPKVKLTYYQSPNQSYYSNDLSYSSYS